MAKDPADVIEIRDDGLDADAVMVALRRGLAARGEVYAKSPHFPSFHGQGDRLVDGASEAADLAFQLQAMAAFQDALHVSCQFVSGRLKVPLVGGLVDRFRSELHNLVVFYANLLAAGQASFNAHAVQANNRVAQLLRRQDSDLEELREEVRRLRQQLLAIEAEHRRERAAADAGDGR